MSRELMMKKSSAEAAGAKPESALPFTRQPISSEETKQASSKPGPPMFTRKAKPAGTEPSNQGFELRKAPSASDAVKPADKKDQPSGELPKTTSNQSAN